MKRWFVHSKIGCDEVVIRQWRGGDDAVVRKGTGLSFFKEEMRRRGDGTVAKNVHI
jgi:hypothetical protein